MAVTAADLVAQVRRLTDNDLPELTPDSDILEELNEVYTEVLAAYPWPQLSKPQYTCSAYSIGPFSNDAVISLDGPILQAGMVMLNDVPAGMDPLAWGLAQYTTTTPSPKANAFIPLRQRMSYPQDWDARTGYPQEFFLEPVAPPVTFRLQLWPFPSSPTMVRFIVQANDIQFRSLSDTFVFDDRFAPVISYGAAVRILSREGDDSGRVESYQREYEGFVQRMKLNYLDEVSRPFALGGEAVPVPYRKYRRSRRRRWY